LARNKQDIFSAHSPASLSTCRGLATQAGNLNNSALNKKQKKEDVFKFIIKEYCVKA
jgi:hypothetical protein